MDICWLLICPHQAHTSPQHQIRKWHVYLQFLRHSQFAALLSAPPDSVLRKLMSELNSIWRDSVQEYDTPAVLEKAMLLQAVLIRYKLRSHNGPRLCNFSHRTCGILAVPWSRFYINYDFLTFAFNSNGGSSTLDTLRNSDCRTTRCNNYKHLS